MHTGTHYNIAFTKAGEEIEKQIDFCISLIN
jgi:hypothetical protein